MIVTEVDTLVANSAKPNPHKDESSINPLVNLLFEEQNAIHTKAIHLDFPKFDDTDPMGWVYCAN